MRPLVVVKLDPVANDTTGVLQSFKAVTVDTLFLQRTDHPLHQAVLLRGVRGDEFLLQTVAFDQRRVCWRRPKTDHLKGCVPTEN